MKIIECKIKGIKDNNECYKCFMSEMKNKFHSRAQCKQNNAKNEEFIQTIKKEIEEQPKEQLKEQFEEQTKKKKSWIKINEEQLKEDFKQLRDINKIAQKYEVSYASMRHQLNKRGLL